MEGPPSVICDVAHKSLVNDVAFIYLLPQINKSQIRNAFVRVLPALPGIN